jgi:large-conductance mechanosensitive channel
MGVQYLKVAIDLAFKIVNDHPYVILFIIIGFALTFLIALITSIKAAKKNKKETSKKE